MIYTVPDTVYFFLHVLLCDFRHDLFNCELVPFRKPQRLTAFSHRAGSNSAVAQVVASVVLTFTELGVFLTHAL